LLERNATGVRKACPTGAKNQKNSVGKQAPLVD
jgi:hypothetical protein